MYFDHTNISVSDRLVIKGIWKCMCILGRAERHRKGWQEVASGGDSILILEANV